MVLLVSGRATAVYSERRALSVHCKAANSPTRVREDPNLFDDGRRWHSRCRHTGPRAHSAMERPLWATRHRMATIGRERRSIVPSPFLSNLGSRVTRLLLTADGKHKHRVKFCNVSIQRDITIRTLPDHKFSKVRSDRLTDKRNVFQHIDCPHDVFNARWCFRQLMLKEEGRACPLAMSARSLKDAAARIATIPQIMDKVASHRHALNRLRNPSTIPAVREHPRSRLRKLRNT